MTPRRSGSRRCASGVALLVSLGAATSAIAAERFRFVDATAEAGVRMVNVCGADFAAKGWLHESFGAGAAWLDYDGDGLLDLYLVNGSTHERKPGAGEPNRLYRNEGKGRFRDVTDAAGVGDRGWGYGVAVGDYDNDGRPDLYVTNFHANVLYRNLGNGRFEDVTRRAGVGHEQYSTSAAFFDMENDGDLDLYVGNYMATGPGNIPRRATPAAMNALCTYKGIPVYCGPMGQVPLQDVLYRNDGDGTFTDVTRSAGVWLDTPRYALGVVTADYDNDGDQDIYVANDSVANSLWENQGNGTFRDVGLQKLAALNADGRPQAGMGTDFGDYDGDGWLDLVVTNFAHDLNTLYRNLTGKFFIDESAVVGLGVTYLTLSWGVGFVDFDHDGVVELFIANGHTYPEVDAHDIGTTFRQPNHLFVQEGGRFREVGAEAGPGFGVRRSFRGTAFGDYDNDGDVDLLVTALGEDVLLLRNDGPKRGHFLQLDLDGKRSNRDGVGARVTLVAGEKRWVAQRRGGGSYLSASDPRLHFGLGAVTKLDRVEIVWPSKVRDVLTDVAVDRVLVVAEGSTAAR